MKKISIALIALEVRSLYHIILPGIIMIEPSYGLVCKTSKKALNGC